MEKEWYRKRGVIEREGMDGQTKRKTVGKREQRRIDGEEKRGNQRKDD